MKPTTKSAILGAVLSAAVIVTASQFIPSEVQAQVTPVTPTNPSASPKEQFKVVGVGHQAHVATEKELDQLGADGWRLRVATANAVIFSRFVQ